MITQVEIARRIGIDVSSVNKILNRRPGPVFRKETIKKVFRVAREMGYDFSRLKHQHRRRFPRREVAIGAELSIFQKDGTIHDQGVATIRDISVCGARVSDVALRQGTFPASPFTVALRPMEKSLDGVEIRGHVVRVQAEGPFGYGINFEKPEPGIEKKIRRIQNG
jgi:transcriptional regulator with XRE-family HTH domain